MKIFLRRSSASEDDKNSGFLFLNKHFWNDWYLYETLYEVSYIKGDKNIRLGSVKIGKKGMEGASAGSTNTHDRIPLLSIEFEGLNDDYFSLGQDSSYYESLLELGGNLRAEILEALNDIAFSEESFEKAVEEKVTTTSLLRDVSLLSVTGKFRRLAQGRQGDIKYSFEYQSKKRRKIEPYTINFEVDPKSNPPTNVQVIIGRNGVGKTTLITDMIKSLLRGDAVYGKFSINTSDDNDKVNGKFANLVSVSFSAFDDSEPASELKDVTQRIKYSYIGLKSKSKSGEPKSTYVLEGEFFRSLEACIKFNKLDLWRRSIRTLQSDQIFNDSDVMRLGALDPSVDSFESECRKMFKRFSSGHRVVMLTITKLVETIEEKSLVLLDEPEAHLHPPLLSAFIRALSDLMKIRNGVAIIATHSPVVLQEVPKSCVWVLSRVRAEAKAERLDLETFGENVGVLTKNVFGLEVTSSGFHTLIKQYVEKSNNLQELQEYFNNELGVEGRAIAQTLINHKS